MHFLVETGRVMKVCNFKLFALRKFDITPEQSFILSILDDNSKFNQIQLRKLLFKDRYNIARLIGVLEKNVLLKKFLVSIKDLLIKFK